MPWCPRPTPSIIQVCSIFRELAYAGIRPETSIAEKTEAMVHLALANSRMKDFFDIWRLAMSRPFDGETVRLAIRVTFERRQTPQPSELPLALTDEFAADPPEAPATYQPPNERSSGSRSGGRS